MRTASLNVMMRAFCALTPPAPSSATINTPAASLFIPLLFVSQSLNRIQRRGLTRSIEAKEHTHRRGKSDRDDDGLGRRHGAPAREMAEQRCAAHTDEHADEPAEHADRNALHEELRE